MSFGRFERSRSDQPMSDINVTPLVDVMLVLMVIFMLTAPLLVRAVKVDLPQAQATQAMDAPASLLLVVDQAGVVYADDRAMSATDLVQMLNLAAQQDPLTEVQLRADAAVPYGRVVQVMGVAQKAGLSRIGFVAIDATSP
jgi:biopolymer transport protein TolR